MMDRKAKIIHLFKDAESADQGNQFSNNTIDGDKNTLGNGNITVYGNVNIENNKKKIKKTVVTPGPEHISSAQAYKIQQRIRELADLEITSGTEPRKAYARWWTILKKHFQVTSYKLIPADLFDEAMDFLTQHKAMNRPKLRKTDNKRWKGKYYTAIYARCNERGISKAQLYALIKDRMGLRVTSLKQLSDKNLKHLYNIVFALR